MINSSQQDHKKYVEIKDENLHFDIGILELKGLNFTVYATAVMSVCTLFTQASQNLFQNNVN